MSMSSSSSMVDKDVSLKAAQVRAVQRMLAFNEDAAVSYEHEYSLPPAGSSHNQWKILIYDAPCRSIISPILSVQQLRRRGVTLHLLLHSEREAIPDVPVIYFCRPNKENLARIAQDSAAGLYQRAHLNFCTKLDRALMEDFAKLLVQTSSLDRIASIHDQYLDYVCYEKSLFSLHKTNCYALMNESGMTEALMDQVMTEIAYGLFSVVATTGTVPILRCPKGGAPEMVARKLNKMITEHPTLLRNKMAMSSRPLLVLLDRNTDLITAIQHTSTYQALIDDLLTHKANRVEFEVVTGDANAARPKKTAKRFDLDPDEDPFYLAHKFQPFPEAIESNASELEQVTARESEIRSKAAGGGASNNNRDPMAVLGTNELATAVESLPALLDRKTQLEMHTSILQAVMNQVAARDVPQFYELESSLATGMYKNDLATAKSKVLALVETKGNVQDKIRLIMVYALTTSAKMADLDQVTAALQQAVESDVAVALQQNNKVAAEQSKETLALGLRALGYLKQLRSMHMIPSAADMIQLSAADGDAGGRGGPKGDSTMFSSFMKTATTQATGLLAKATDKVSSMLGKIHKHHATVVVENLCEMKPNSEDEAYLYLDPKVKGDVDVHKLRATGATRAPIRSVLCFVIGGGSYGEYQNLQMLTNDGRCQSLTYGSTEILGANDFLQQLGQLG